MSQIRELLRAEIEASGPISFARFMEMALYCPKNGYYERAPGVIGSSGDFYTSASLGPAFGQLLAWQFAQSCEELPVERITWVEAGAHDGTLALAMLNWLGKNRPTLLERLTYCIIEPSANRQGWQEQTLRPFQAHVRWEPSLNNLAPINGIIFSNELLDAFPVHRVAWNASTREWFEWGVGLESRLQPEEPTKSPMLQIGHPQPAEAGTPNRLTWMRLAAPSLDIQLELAAAGFDLPQPLLNVLPDGFVIEVTPSARTWWARAAELLKCGKLMTIDYGGTVEELLMPERVGGTLRAYFQHHATADLLERPGEQDITAHVNFTQLQRAGEKAGLKTEALLTQEIFLSRIIGAAGATTELRKLQPLIHPEHLGHSFRVLIQSRPSLD